MSWLIELVLWWTGFVVWIAGAVLFVAAGLPSGTSVKGVTVLSFYSTGVVVWRLLPENKDHFAQLKRWGYHFLHVGGRYHLGLSLPSWLARRIANRRTRA